MTSLGDIRNARLTKLSALRAAGVNPYPIATAREYSIADAVKRFAALSKKKSITLAGRIMAIRGQGGVLFFDLFDGTGKFQALLKRDEAVTEELTRFESTADIGDFVEVSGALFKTKRDEKTILAKEWKMLAKSLRPMPEKWHGLQDVEERFRRRYLDTLMNEEVRERFRIRSRIVTELRRILDEEGFLEVETSMLQELPGGANAEPFRTHHDYLGIDVHLRIALELDLKKLAVGGYPKVYEIGRNFRNEAIDVTHNPEFTMVEWYEAWSDATKQMAFTESVLRTLVKNIFKKMSVMCDGNTIEFGKAFGKMTFFELLERYALISNPARVTRDDLLLAAKRLGVLVSGTETSEKLMDAIYKRACRPKIIQPTFIVDYPVGMLPLAKRREDNPTIADAFQLLAGGMELVKAFSELNDPLDQAERFREGEAAKAGGDKEAQTTDKDFLEAMEYGMPPMGGVGIGIDRLTMLLTDTRNIREVIFFPTLRPR